MLIIEEIPTGDGGFIVYASVDNKFYYKNLKGVIKHIEKVFGEGE